MSPSLHVPFLWKTHTGGCHHGQSLPLEHFPSLAYCLQGALFSSPEGERPFVLGVLAAALGPGVLGLSCFPFDSSLPFPFPFPLPLDRVPLPFGQRVSLCFQ